MRQGRREVHLIEEPVAAAIGAGIDISKPCGNMIVDVGGGTSDIAVISLEAVLWLILHLRRLQGMILMRQSCVI